jgi:hypothetical protein
VGGSVLTLRVKDPDLLSEAAQAVAGLAVDQDPHVNVPEGEIRLTVSRPEASSEAIRRFDERGLGLVSVELQQPSLDDVFLTLTGQSVQRTPDAEPATDSEEVAA